MEIIVCIKQVPDTEEINSVKINSQTNTMVREGIKNIINPFDENAIEEAIKLRDQHGGKVTVISMGPPQVEAALRSALAMGADEAILICDRAFAGSDTLATSYTLAQAIKKIGKFDIVLFGKQAIDGDTAQVGPGVAEQLGIAQITYIRKIEIKDNILKAERALENSFEVVEVKLPCAVTVTKEINEPRYASMKGLLTARKKQIHVWSAEDLGVNRDKIGLDGSPTQVVKIFTPQTEHESEILDGTVSEIADKLISKLTEHKLF